ncbi:MAG: Tetratricopeptide repeat protein [Bacteroidetes bacterium ADurb.Bin408]|nr:MAG: Tetratricopeptide repeat protein [Bacteroidetes bacterium ADurb.Bin408]
MNLAWTYFLMKNYRSASYFYKRTTDIDPQNANAFLYLGYSHLNMNDKEAACFYFNKSSALGSFEARENLRKFCE